MGLWAYGDIVVGLPTKTHEWMILLLQAEGFKIYTQYCTNYPK